MAPMIRSAALLAAWLTVAPAMAAEWQVADSGSRIGFVATYEDTAFEAWFRSFDAAIRFDPDAPADASFDIRIDVMSVDSNSPDRDEGMRGEEWLATDRHPEARFLAEGVEKLSGNRFQATGPLTLKDVRRTIEVPFTWEQSGDEAVLTAETEVQRTGFDIGTGDWAEDDTIGFTVTIKARLALTRR
ncbi:MAG: YceI family protein [Gammaproteobacteria bacterium]|nr:YceI family protein [Gammaproteobacteria bacterium]